MGQRKKVEIIESHCIQFKLPFTMQIMPIDHSWTRVVSIVGGDVVSGLKSRPRLSMDDVHYQAEFAFDSTNFAINM